MSDGMFSFYLNGWNATTATIALPPNATGNIAVPHVWTEEEITALPEFDNDHGWFYGLVACKNGEQEDGVELAEILPGLGWTRLDPPDVAENWLRISADLARYRPPRGHPS